MSMSSLLTLENVGISYGNVSVIKHCNFTLPQGRILSLLGESGCGKSTLLKAIAGLLPLSSGKMHLGETTVASTTHSLAPEHRGIGMIFQDYALFPHLTVVENVMFGLHKLDKTTQKQKATETLQLVKLERYAKRFPHELSGGQQQRVAIARALVCEPKVLLFDEPFSNLDVGIRQSLMGDIKRLLRARNMSAIFVTHDKTEAFSMADDIAILDEGEIVQFGEPQALYDFPANRYIAELLGHGVIIPASRKADSWQTELGEISAADASAVTVWENEQSEADIFLRPHQLHLQADDKGRYQIIHCAFYGDYYQYDIQLPSHRIQLMTQQRLAVGQNVHIAMQLSAESPTITGKMHKD